MRRRPSSVAFPLLALVSVAVLGPVMPAGATTPSPSMSEVSPVAVGNASGSTVLSGFQVKVRHLGGGPVPGAVVVMELTPGISLFTAQDPSVTVDCVGHRLLLQTDQNGESTVQLRFGGFENDMTVGVSADGVFMTSIRARSIDIDGDGRVGVGDVSLFQQNVFHNPSAPETDFDGGGSTNLPDLALLIDELMAAGLMQAVACP